MKKILLAFVALFTVAATANAQQFFNTPVSHVEQYHTTVGTTTADAIASASVLGNVLSWSICNDAVNTSTYLLVGEAADAATDGRMLAPGACYVCENCTAATLKAMKVKAQAASNGYSVTQYRK